MFDITKISEVDILERLDSEVDILSLLPFDLRTLLSVSQQLFLYLLYRNLPPSVLQEDV